MAPDYMKLAKLTKVQKKRWESLAKIDIVPTKFFDVPTLQRLGFFDITKMLLDQCGLGAFLEKTAPTYKRYLLEFLSTLELHDEGNTITFNLNDVERRLTHLELREIIGVSRPPTKNALKPPTDQIAKVWSAVTGSDFDSRKGETNSKLIHPCLILVHKAIRMAFMGQSETNKFTVADLGWFWTLFESSNAVTDWASIFLSSCLREQGKPTAKGKLAIGGMITVIARHFEQEPPDWFCPHNGSHLFDEKSLITAHVLSHPNAGHVHWKTPSYFPHSIYLPCQLPCGPSPADFCMLPNNTTQALVVEEAAPMDTDEQQLARSQHDRGAHIIPRQTEPGSSSSSGTWQQVLEGIQGIITRQTDIEMTLREVLANQQTVFDMVTRIEHRQESSASDFQDLSLSNLSINARLDGLAAEVKTCRDIQEVVALRIEGFDNYAGSNWPSYIPYSPSEDMIRQITTRGKTRESCFTNHPTLRRPHRGPGPSGGDRDGGWP